MRDDTRWGDDPRDREERDREHDDDGLRLGRGSSSRDEQTDHSSPSRHDERWPDPRERDLDPRDAFMQSLNLPRGLEREIVHDPRDREYTLRGSETRTLSTVGAFRVVPARDLRDRFGREADPRDGDLRHLREQGLINTVRIDGRRDVAVVLTDRGRDLLESHRDRGYHPRQEFYSGLKRERELEHDAQVYQAYLSIAERLAERDARIERVVLDYELKREYQQWLHERDRDGDGRPDRDPREVEDWALEHDLPYFDGHVHFPDVRIEYEIDGRHDHEDVEVVTIHYRGAHGAAVGRSGFSSYRGSSARIGGRSGTCGGRSPDPHLAEELLD
jgi:DNA-binding MarR family transcriptional regulator